MMSGILNFLIVQEFLLLLTENQLMTPHVNTTKSYSVLMVGVIIIFDRKKRVVKYLILCS